MEAMPSTGYDRHVVTFQLEDTWKANLGILS